MSTLRKILVVGATGKQGGAVVNALLKSPSASSIKIFAPTRDPDSPSAKRLAAKSTNIKPIKGQIEDVQAIFKEIGEPVDAMFAVTIPSMKKSEKNIEEVQGKALVDAAIANGVKHFVFTSVDRGGARSDTDGSYVPHFSAKYRVEVYLKAQAAKAGMTWTILRPVFFLDNLLPGFLGKVSGAWWASMDKNTKLQVVATKDIGIFAAKALEAPEQYKNRAISLAGDELTFAEANEKFRKLFGTPLPKTFGMLGGFMKWMIEDINLMWKWFVEVGYGADVAECKKINPEMQDFETWLKESSGHKRQ
jgi:uncharacterized protein YbjT (DUF2867 family)